MVETFYRVHIQRSMSFPLLEVERRVPRIVIILGSEQKRMRESEAESENASARGREIPAGIRSKGPRDCSCVLGFLFEAFLVLDFDYPLGNEICPPEWGPIAFQWTPCQAQDINRNKRQCGTHANPTQPNERTNETPTECPTGHSVTRPPSQPACRTSL